MQKAKKQQQSSQRTSQRSRAAPTNPRPQRSAPLNQSRSVVARGARIANGAPTRDCRIVVTHREYLTDIGDFPSLDFSARSLSVNPGLNGTFPWLSSIANNYEFYEFRSLRFEYVPFCAATDAGNLMFAVDFDAADSLPTSKQEMMAYLGAAQVPVWQSHVMNASGPDLHKFGKQKFIRNATPAANLDIKTYDVAKFIYAGSGVTAVKGSIYVSYSVELSTPHVNPLDPGEFSSEIRQHSAVSVLASPLAGASLYAGDRENVSIKDAATIVIGAVGDYLLDIAVWGTGIVAATAPNVLLPAAGFGATLLATQSLLVNAPATMGAGLQGRLRITKPNTPVALSFAGFSALTDLVLKVVPWKQDFQY